MNLPTTTADLALDRLERFAARVPFLIVLLIGCNLAIRLAISPNLEWDEAEFVGHIGFALGYPNSHPPLLNWIVGAFHDLTGNWVAAFAIPKHLLLAATYLLCFDIIRRITGRKLAGAVAAASLLLVPEIVFYSEYTRTHAVLVMCAAAASLHAVVLIVERGIFTRFIWLGIALATGFLAKYNFALFVAGLAMAIAATPLLRRTILVPKLALSVSIVVALVTPHVLWALDNLDLATERLTKLDRIQSEAAWIDLPGIGLDGFLTLIACLAAWCGLLSVLWWLAWIVARRDGVAAPAPAARVRAFARLFGLTAAIGVGLLAVFILVADVHNVRMRYLTPMLMAFPLWLILRWPIDLFAVAARRYLATVGAVGLAVTVAWPFAAMGLASPFNFPFDEMAERMRAGIAPPVAIWSRDREIFANLVIRIQGASVWDARAPADRILVVWLREGQDPDHLATALDPLYRPVGESGAATFPSRGLIREPRSLRWRLYERCPSCATGAGEGG